MNQSNIALRNKILRGLVLSYNRLVEKSQKEDKELVFSQDGKIVRVKANQLGKIDVQLPPLQPE